MTERRTPSGPGPARGGARPTGARPGAQVPAPRGGRRQVTFSGRAAALGVVLVVLMLAYAYPMRVYLAQQAEIARMEAEAQERRARIQALADEVARWNDDEYVKAQARARLLLVEVDEQVYVVGVDPRTPDDQGEVAPPPWYEQVWTSVQTADDPPVADGP